MNTILIDDRGDVWANASLRLRDAFAPTCSDDEYCDYLIRNLGFVSVSVFGRSCQFKLHPAVLTSNTLDSLIHWLATRQFDRYVMNYYDREWKFELHGEADVVTGRLLMLFSLKQLVRPSDFIAEEMVAGEQADNPMFASLIKSWPELVTNLHQDGLRNILNTLTKGRYFLVRVDSAHDRLVYHAAGNGFTKLNNDWLSSVRETPIDQQPDRAYGRWVRAGYKKILTENRPMLEAIDAIVDSPEVGRHRLRYQRIMLPARSPDNTRWLLGASAMDNSIDLRAKQA